MPTRETKQVIEIPSQHVADIELPKEVHRLYDLAYNLWWTWTPPARDLFSSIDARSWSHYRNPIQLLINVDRRHWDHLLDNDAFVSSYNAVVDAFDAYLARSPNTWFDSRYPDGAGPIAYFSMEYGVHQSMAIYSGGLGILSGDHLKSASDLGLPLVGVGLLYHRGYFRQTIDVEGRQQHFYPEFDFGRLPVRPALGHTGRDVLVSVPLPGREVKARVWVAQIGRVPLLLLDTDIPDNDPSDRPITDTLYVRGRAMRLAQEVVLGVGGAEALATLGIEPAIWHINEGHSSLLQLARAGRLVESGRSFPEALEEIRSTTVFTTHTPVPAGNEKFESELAREYLADWPRRLGVAWEDLAELAGLPEESTGHFAMTALGLRTSRWANGVSEIHGGVSRRMWQGLFHSPSPEETPIAHITNGVHIPTWLGPEMQALLKRHFGHDWLAKIHHEDMGDGIRAIPDGELWKAHEAQSRRLGRFTRSRLREQLARHGRSPEELRRVDDLFRSDALTIGFARRFATYKRASLLFSDPHELRRLLCNPARPVQVIFAGKAHPADRPGQELIQHIFQLSQSEPFVGRVVFLEDYDMRVAGMLVQGVDVWLNTPRRPLEASGTSGQKAAINGALNCSILDGWWPEAFDGTNGWAIADAGVLDDPQQQDIHDAQSLYRTLEDQVLPTFFDRPEGELPGRWIGMMKRAITTVATRFSAERMVRDYTTRAYFREAGGAVTPTESSAPASTPRE